MIKRSILFILFIFCSKLSKGQEAFFNINDIKDNDLKNGFIIGASDLIALYKKEDKDVIKYTFQKGVYELFDRPFFLYKEVYIKGKEKSFITKINKRLGLENEVFQKILDIILERQLNEDIKGTWGLIEFEPKDLFEDKEDRWIDDSIKESRELLLDPKLDKDFVLSLKKDLKYINKIRILYYLAYFGEDSNGSKEYMLNKRNLISKERGKIEILMNEADFNDESLLKTGFFYRQFLDLYIDECGRLYRIKDKDEYFAAKFNLIDVFFKSKLIKEFLWFNLIREYLNSKIKAKSKNTTTIISNYSLYQRKSTNLSFKHYIESLYKKELS